jgi:hypothetical protein
VGIVLATDGIRERAPRPTIRRANPPHRANRSESSSLLLRPKLDFFLDEVSEIKQERNRAIFLNVLDLLEGLDH